MRIRLAVCLVLAALATGLLACSKVDSETAHKSHVVDIKPNLPISSVTVARGDSVRWKNHGTEQVTLIFSGSGKLFDPPVSSLVVMGQDTSRSLKIHKQANEGQHKYEDRKVTSMGDLGVAIIVVKPGGPLIPDPQ